MFSFRPFLTEHNPAALNPYATRAAAFTDQSTGTGAIRRVRLDGGACSGAPDTANHLTRSETNREIGLAMGILMANDGQFTGQQAFDQLRTASQDFNRKLHHITADVAITGGLPKAALKLAKRR